MVFDRPSSNDSAKDFVMVRKATKRQQGTLSSCGDVTSLSPTSPSLTSLSRTWHALSLACFGREPGEMVWRIDSAVTR